MVAWFNLGVALLLLVMLTFFVHRKGKKGVLENKLSFGVSIIVILINLGYWATTIFSEI